MRDILFCQEPLCKVTVSVTAASVNVEATVTDSTGNAVGKADELKALTMEELTARIQAVVPGVVVESTATVTDPIDKTLVVPINNINSAQTAAGLGAGLGVGLGLPVFCAFLFFLHVQLNFAADKRGKYLKYRFSHTNRSVPCGFMPKDARHALWAEIKGTTKASQIAPMEIGMAEPEKEEKTNDV